MGELLGMAARRISASSQGDSITTAPTLERIDAAMIAAGFDWHDGKAAELDHEPAPDLR